MLYAVITTPRPDRAKAAPMRQSRTEWIRETREVGRASIYKNRYRRDQRARTLYQLLGLDRKVADRSMSLADVHREQGRYEEAQDAYEQARAIYQRLSIDEGAATCGVGLGDVHRDLGRYQEAQDAYEQARTTYQRLGLDGRVAYCTNVLGDLHRHLGRYSEAQDAYERARAIYERLRNPQYAGCTLSLGHVLRDVGRYQEAQDAYERARTIYERLRMDEDAATCTMHLGNVHRDLGRHEDAQNAYEQALIVYRRLGLDERATVCTVNLGIQHWELGRSQQATAAFERARELYRFRGDALAAASLSVTMGLLNTDLGRYEQAEGAYEQALITFQRLGLAWEVADCALQLARLWNVRGDVELGRLERAGRVLALAVPALLALDSMRFQFRSATDRQRWAERMADEFEFVFSVAAQAGDPALVADLVEASVNHGVHTTSVRDDASARAAGLALSDAATTGTHGWVGLRAPTLAGSVTLLDATRLRMAPPPPLLAPYDRRVLGSYRLDTGQTSLRVW